MSVQATSWVIENSQQKGSALLLLIMIANHAHADGSNAFPSIKTLAAECRMSERQIIRLVAHLEKSGELIIERSGGKKVHHYAITMSPKTNKKMDKMSGLKMDKMSGLKMANPDKSSNPTLTNRAANPDKLSNPPRPPYKENRHEPSMNPHTHSEAAGADCLALDELRGCGENESVEPGQHPEFGRRSPERSKQGRTSEHPAATGQTTGLPNSRFTLKLCRQYAKHLHDTGQGIRNPQGWGKSIHDSGCEDDAISGWLDSGKTTAAPGGKKTLAGEMREKIDYLRLVNAPSGDYTEEYLLDDLREHFKRQGRWDEALAQKLITRKEGS